MNRVIFNLLVGLLIVIGLGLLYLSNTGILSFDKPYINQFSSELPAANPLVAFVNVNLIPMDSEHVVENQTVIVRKGVIEWLGPSDQVEVQPEAIIVDGRGKYLIPGLVDMHVHIQFEDDMLLWVANGVTSVRNMWGNTDKMLQFGFPNQLALRRQIELGTLFGPTIYTAGPVMEGPPAFHPLSEVFDLPDTASESVAWQKASGYDFIKVYDHLSPEVYQATIDAAHKENIPVVGHVPFSIGLDGVLESGQLTIEHLTGYIDPDTVKFIIPEELLNEYAMRTHEAGVWNCVTLSEYPKSKETPEGFERLQNQPGMLYVSPLTRMLSPFLYLMASKSHTYDGTDYPDRIAELNRQMVTALHEAGAGILLGTDSAQAYHLPGFSVHEELAMLVEAGFSPYEAIEAGTRNAAEALGKSAEFGTLEAGKRADMILLENNPLDDVANIQKRIGVMLRGRWMTERQLETMLNGLVDSYKPRLEERIWPFSLIVVAIYFIVRKNQGSSRE